MRTLHLVCLAILLWVSGVVAEENVWWEEEEDVSRQLDVRTSRKYIITIHVALVFAFLNYRFTRVFDAFPWHHPLHDYRFPSPL